MQDIQRIQIYEVKFSLLRNKDGRMGEVRRTICSTEGKKQMKEVQASIRKDKASSVMLEGERWEGYKYLQLHGEEDHGKKVSWSCEHYTTALSGWREG